VVIQARQTPFARSRLRPKAASCKAGGSAGQGFDRIEVRAGALIRNGTPVVETPWRQGAIAYDLRALWWCPGTSDVLGERAMPALDFHLWGPLPADHVIRTAVLRLLALKRSLDRYGFSPLAAGGEGRRPAGRVKAWMQKRHRMKMFNRSFSLTN